MIVEHVITPVERHDLHKCQPMALLTSGTMSLVYSIPVAAHEYAVPRR